MSLQQQLFIFQMPFASLNTSTSKNMKKKRKENNEIKW
jgi:hypothetical protein